MTDPCMDRMWRLTQRFSRIWRATWRFLSLQRQLGLEAVAMALTSCESASLCCLQTALCCLQTALCCLQTAHMLHCSRWTSHNQLDFLHRMSSKLCQFWAVTSGPWKFMLRTWWLMERRLGSSLPTKRRTWCCLSMTPRVRNDSLFNTLLYLR